MSVGDSLDEEINDICRELINLKLKMAAVPPTSSVISPDNQANQLDDDDSGVNLQQSLEQLSDQLARERERRQQLEVELQELGVSQNQNSREMMEALGAEREELAQLTRERDELREWLQRGVSECRRVADEALRLKGELDATTKRCRLLEEKKRDLEKKIDAVRQQLTESQSQLELSREKERLLEISVEEHTSSAQQLEHMHARRKEDYEALVAEEESLRRQVDELEESEMCIQLLTERLQLLQAHIERIGHALRKGNIGDLPPDEFFLREHVAEPQKSLDELVVWVKTLLHSLSSAIHQLQAEINSFLSQQRSILSEQYIMQREQLEEMHLETQSTLYKYELEKETLMKEIAQLKMELVRRVTNRTVYEEEDSESQENSIVAVESWLSSNEQLESDNSQLREENNAMREKLRRFKIDWRKVHESQLRFQELQLNVDMIEQTNAKLRTENESLKMLIETRFGELSIKLQQQPQQEKDLLGIKEKPSFNRRSVSTIMVDDTQKKICARGSRSASQGRLKRSVEDEVFQEWKHMLLNGRLE